MKSLIAVLAIAISANVHAYSSGAVTFYISASPLLTSATTSGGVQKAEANAIINDAQELMQSGNASIFLAEKIQLAKDVNPGASDADALEMLLNEAESILN